MTTVIVHQPENAPVAITIPSEYNPFGLSIEEIAEQGVPTGTPFWIIDSSAFPSDRSFRAAWELDVESMGAPSGYGNPDKINQKILDIIEKEKNALLTSELQDDQV